MNSSTSYSMAGNLVSFAFWIVIIAVFVYNLFIRKNKNRAAAATGEDLEKVRQAVRPLLPNEAQSAEIVYAHWENTETHGRTTRTTYYRYAAAFLNEALWVFPLQVDKKTHGCQAGAPMLFTSDKLGKVQVTLHDKQGLLTAVKALFADKNGETFLRLSVDVENLNSSKYLPLNIRQQQECEAFERFITPFAKKVEQENPGIDAIISQNAAKGYAPLAVGLSVGGLAAGILAPSFGMFICLAGLVISIVSKRRGNQGNKALITGIVCMGLSVAWIVLYYTVLFV